MGIVFGIILGIVIMILICCAFYVVTDGEVDGILPLLILLILLFFTGNAIGQEMNTDIKTSNITTYTYQCQICGDNTTTTNEPKVMICDKCIDAIKNMKGE